MNQEFVQQFRSAVKSGEIKLGMNANWEICFVIRNEQFPTGLRVLSEEQRRDNNRAICVIEGGIKL
jgi:hypothetical protein